MATLMLPPAPHILLTDTSDSDEQTEEFQVGDDVSSKYEKHHIEIAKKIFVVVLEDWMHGYEVMYTQYHYTPLFDHLLQLVSEQKVVQFLLPGFPVKSANVVRKVLGYHPDFAEFMAIQSFLITARKIQKVYTKGVKITILSDYHTFDQYIGVTEEAYNMYHAEIKEMIFNVGGDDIIEVLSLSSFPEFQDTMTTQLSTRLGEEYGNSEFLEKFDENVKEDSDLLERYRQMLKFMQTDQEIRLPGSPRSRRSRTFLKEVACGMMSQGIALDAFLKEQELLSDYVRVSIHHHHPKKGKFAIDLFKQHTAVGASSTTYLRTPWHNTVLFDALKGEFFVDHKTSFLEQSLENSITCTVMYKEKDWFLIRLFFDKTKKVVLTEKDINVSMIKNGCGMIVENVSGNRDVKSDVFDTVSMRMMIKHFGVVIFRGFSPFQNEKELFDYYYACGDHGMVPWKTGPVHTVKPTKDSPGYVNTTGPVPIHWDLMLPPPYMGISQSSFNYEDFTCREFLLYCHRNSKSGTPGATTFIDASGVLLSLQGDLTEKWKDTIIATESRLTKEENKSLYFGGRDNTFNYPLVQRCSWTNKDVLRWFQLWIEEEHPGTEQEQIYSIKSKRDDYDISLRELEDEVLKVVFDERFFFGHVSEEGDQVYVNNYTMLHGRNAFTNERELWRVQLVPPSENVPPYFKTHGHAYFTHDH